MGRLPSLSFVRAVGQSGYILKLSPLLSCAAGQDPGRAQAGRSEYRKRKGKRNINWNNKMLWEVEEGWVRKRKRLESDCYQVLL